jgi:hypothetical protein
MEGEKRKRIGSAQGALMIAVAGVIDGVQFLLNFIPILGWILTSLISIFAWLAFLVWFMLNDVSYLKGKAVVLKFALIFCVPIIEVISLLNDLPAWTAYIVIMLLIVKAEDVLYNKTEKSILMKKAIKRMA